jgi:hypothetical protein
MHMMPATHKCFMTPKAFTAKDAKEHKDAKFFFFDFETYIGEDGTLIPNLAVGFLSTISNSK